MIPTEILLYWEIFARNFSITFAWNTLSAAGLRAAHPSGRKEGPIWYAMFPTLLEPIDMSRNQARGQWAHIINCYISLPNKQIRRSYLRQKKKEKEAQIRTPAAAGREPEAAEGRAIAGPSGGGGRRRRDSSPAISLAASDSMMSPLDLTANNIPAVNSREKERSVSKAQTLICARKSKAGEVGP